jgi:hypothetical protein
VPTGILIVVHPIQSHPPTTMSSSSSATPTRLSASRSSRNPLSESSSSSENQSRRTNGSKSSSRESTSSSREEQREQESSQEEEERERESSQREQAREEASSQEELNLEDIADYEEEDTRPSARASRQSPQASPRSRTQSPRPTPPSRRSSIASTPPQKPIAKQTARNTAKPAPNRIPLATSSRDESRRNSPQDMGSRRNESRRNSPVPVVLPPGEAMLETNVYDLPQAMKDIMSVAVDLSLTFLGGEGQLPSRGYKAIIVGDEAIRFHSAEKTPTPAPYKVLLFNIHTATRPEYAIRSDMVSALEFIIKRLADGYNSYYASLSDDIRQRLINHCQCRIGSVDFPSIFQAKQEANALTASVVYKATLLDGHEISRTLIEFTGIPKLDVVPVISQEIYVRNYAALGFLLRYTDNEIAQGRNVPDNTRIKAAIIAIFDQENLSCASVSTAVARCNAKVNGDTKAEKDYIVKLLVSQGLYPASYESAIMEAFDLDSIQQNRQRLYADLS